MNKFQIKSKFKPAGDQIQAIARLTESVKSKRPHQVLLGVTGSGKTFTIANLIQRLQRPTLVISPNKTLAAQLYAEFKSFFPNNAVEYFISYYDYYQPEAYVPQSDTFIEKDASINDHIDRLRLKATSSLMERKDVIVVASVSCIYGLGSPVEYKALCVGIEAGQTKPRQVLLDELIANHYSRNDVEFQPGNFRVRGDTIEIFPAYLETAVRVELFGDDVERIREFHPVSGEILGEKKRIFIYPARHFVTSRETLDKALGVIEEELNDRLAYFKKSGKLLEAQRLEQRTRYDLEMLRELGFCNGIENYSRPLSGRKTGERPSCLIDYFPTDFLTIIDESHVAVPQIGGMYEGDRSRKQTLVNFGFRLPSALDNRPLKFNEFEELTSQTVYVSATPGPFELTKSRGEIVEQVIRPTGLVDPEVVVHPIEGQLPDLMRRITGRVARQERTLVTTLTKRTAEDLTAFLSDQRFRVRYMHSDIDALQRIDILQGLRKGDFDILVGINLLREGLDIPEVSLVAVLDADKEGFLRSETSLIQVCGRAARHVGGGVVLYADKMTGSMRRALDEMNRRRAKQVAYNTQHRISPKTITKAVQVLEEFQTQSKVMELMKTVPDFSEAVDSPKKLGKVIRHLEKQMKEAAEVLDFERAAAFRDKMREIRQMKVRRGKEVKS